MAADLNQRFPLKYASFVTKNGLAALEVNHPAATGLIYPHGAHVVSWKPAGQATDVLWVSAMSHFAEGKPIRGGVPICFPWFGPKADDKAAPAHGTVRLRAWDVEAAGEDAAGVTVTLVTRSTEADVALYPHPFEVRHIVTFGARLRMTLSVKNTGAAPARFEEALHTYFAVADVRNVTVAGLDGVEYVDKVDGMKRKRQAGPITITSETDRPYLSTTAAVAVTDPGRGRTITVEKQGSNSTVVWNPWVAKAKAMPDFGDDEWPGMLCVETCNVGENALQLAPGQTHEMTAVVSVR
jgi:glucose-6-phosphate 1-epimerase